MSTANDLPARLRRVVDETGTVAKASRRLDLNPKTLQRAMDGEEVREGTLLVIERRLAEYESRAAGSASEGGAA